MTLTDLCEELRNWFDVSRHCGTFEIKDGTLDLEFLQEGQYFRIVGSVFNDGVHQYPIDGLTDETFKGAIWALAIPQNLIDTLESMNEWEEKNKEALDSPYTSESFGGYSYSKGSEENSKTAVYNAFRRALSRWQKI